MAEGRNGRRGRRAWLAAAMLAPMALTPALLYVQQSTAPAESRALDLVVAAAAAVLMAGTAAAFERLRRPPP